MERASPRSLFATLFLLLLAACADQSAVAAAPAAGSAAPAVDLGGSSRIPRLAGRAGEGEGYGAIQTASTDASMPGMDHGAMGHGPNQSTGQPDTSPSRGAAGRVVQAGTVQGAGTVNSADPARRKINLSHNAIPSIGWPPMTMDFAVAPSVDLGTIKPGGPVTFTMKQGGDGMYVIQSITPAGGGR